MYNYTAMVLLWNWDTVMNYIKFILTSTACIYLGESNVTDFTTNDEDLLLFVWWEQYCISTFDLIG